MLIYFYSILAKVSIRLLILNHYNSKSGSFSITVQSQATTEKILRVATQLMTYLPASIKQNATNSSRFAYWNNIVNHALVMWATRILHVWKIRLKSKMLTESKEKNLLEQKVAEWISMSNLVQLINLQQWECNNTSRFSILNYRNNINNHESLLNG